jgi:SAM-dependent methyltransferase
LTHENSYPKKDGLERLATKNHWDNIYKEQEQHPGRKKPVKRSIFNSYSDYILWESLFGKYLSGLSGDSKVLEVGSAPGDFLIELRDRYNIEPYGVEYSESGAAINRRKFEAAEINPLNVIHDDFFSSRFQGEYKAFFDVVISRGFIEHFDDVQKVIDQHLNLLKTNGILIISIPNLTGLNYHICRLLNREVISIHNLNIMKKDLFKRLFPASKMNILYSGFFGTFDFGIFNAKPTAINQLLYKLGIRFQMILNAAFRIFIRKRMLNSQSLSPYLIFIGTKK